MLVPRLVSSVVAGAGTRGTHGLAVGPPDQVDQHAVEQVAHVVLFRARATLAEAFDEQNRLQHPEVGLGVEACVREYCGVHKLVEAARWVPRSWVR